MKRALEGDHGTIFRYSNHENTVLKQIKAQLNDSLEEDRDELVEFIEHITDEGHRTMVDLCLLIQKFYYHPAQEGSNSIKKVLPAIIGASRLLREKYGSEDPYKKLPPVFSDLDLSRLENRMSDEEIADGGAAMTAYARMQFSEMSDVEVERVRAALFRYCELDTLAMVMLVEYFGELVGASKKKSGVAG